MHERFLIGLAALGTPGVLELNTLEWRPAFCSDLPSFVSQRDGSDAIHKDGIVVVSYRAAEPLAAKTELEG
jgi:hypothetical protein